MFYHIGIQTFLLLPLSYGAKYNSDRFLITSGSTISSPLKIFREFLRGGLLLKRWRFLRIFGHLPAVKLLFFMLNLLFKEPLTTYVKYTAFVVIISLHRAKLLYQNMQLILTAGRVVEKYIKKTKMKWWIIFSRYSSLRHKPSTRAIKEKWIQMKINVTYARFE